MKYWIDSKGWESSWELIQGRSDGFAWTFSFLIHYHLHCALCSNMQPNWSSVLVFLPYFYPKRVWHFGTIACQRLNWPICQDFNFFRKVFTIQFLKCYLNQSRMAFFKQVWSLKFYSSNLHYFKWKTFAFLRDREYAYLEFKKNLLKNFCTEI